MKVLLISPNYTLYKNDVRRCVPPIGLAYIAAYLEKHGYNVKIIDAAADGYWKTSLNGEYITYGLTDEELGDRIRNFNPDVVGASAIFSTQYKNACQVLEIAKKTMPGIVTVIGGSHPTFNLAESEANPNIDYVIPHEGEMALLELLKTGKAKRGFVKNLDELPFPAWHLLNMERYFEINLPQSPYPKGKRVMQLVTSRGCKFRCVFCTTTNFWGNNYRIRSPGNVIKEVATLKASYKIDEIQITDDNFTLNRGRAKEIMKHFNLPWCMPQGAYIPSLSGNMLQSMKKSGCYQLTFAVESGSQRVLEEVIKKPLNLRIVAPLVKQAQELGITVHGFFVCGFPGESKAEMRETYDFAKRCGFNSASFFLATPLVGSELLQICQDNGYLRSGWDYSGQLYKVGNITTPGFTAKEAEQIVMRFNREYNRNDSRSKRFEEAKY